jgi:predicted dehydrogenase
VIIARRARDHAETALAAIRAGCQVLVEKPFCLTAADLDRLLRAATPGQCRSGLVFLHASFMEAFRDTVARSGVTPDSLTVIWSDPAGERRHGEKKTYDASVNVVQDVLPHVWSLVRAMPCFGMARLDRVETRDGGRRVEIVLLAGDKAARAILTRDADRRERRILLRGAGGEMELDFTREPPTIRRDGEELPVAFQAESPLSNELSAFLSDREAGLSDIHQCAEAALLSMEVMARVREAQRETILAGVDRKAMAYAIREIREGGVGADGTACDAKHIVDWAGIPAVPDPGSFVTLLYEADDDTSASGRKEPDPVISRTKT